MKKLTFFGLLILIGLSSVLNAQIPTNGLVGYWPLNGNANDESGNGNNGTAYNLTSISDRFSNPNSAYSFNGSNGYIKVTDSPSIRLTQGTISCWISYSSTSKMQLLQKINFTNAQNQNYDIEINDPSPNLTGPTIRGNYGKLCSNVGAILPLYANQDYNNSSWLHYAGVMASNKMYIYINGVPIDSLSVSGSMTACSGGDLLIGRGWSSYPNWYNGKLDDLRIYNRALNISEITALYNEGNCTTPVPVAQDVSICGPGSSTLIASGGTNYNWYSTESGGTVIWSGSTFNTPYLTQTTTYWVTNVELCESERVPVVVAFIPGIAQNDTTICIGQSLDLSVASTSYIPTDGLVGYWPFNGNANDESGNGNNGTVNGAILTTDRFGILHNAFNFDGINDWILVPDNISLQCAHLTVSIWIKTAFAGSTYVLFKQNISNATNENYGIELHPLNNHKFLGHYGTNCNADQGWVATSGTIPSIIDNTWHNIILTVDSFQLKSYIDGVFAHATNAPNSSMKVCSGSELLIGRGWNSYPKYFPGVLDDIRIYNRALNQSEITILYNEASNSFGYTSLWSTGETTPSITVAPTETTTYYCTIYNGISSCTDSVTVTVIPSFEVICPNDFEVCQNVPSFALTGGLPAGGTYSGDGVISNSIFDPEIAGLGEHLITYVHTDQYGFSAQCTFTITVLPFANVDLGNDQTICETDAAQLLASISNCNNLLWTTNGDGAFSDATLLNPIYYPGQDDIATGTVEVCLTAETTETCIETLSDCKNLVIIHLPEVEAGNDASICFNQVFETAPVTSNASEVLWLTSGDGFFANETEPNTAYYTGTGDIASGQIELCLYVIGINPCIAQYSDCLTLNIFVTPEAEAGADATICTGETYQLAGTAENFGTINWTTGGDGTFSSTSSLTPVYTPGLNDISIGSVNLCLEATGEGGCSTAQVNSCITLMIFDLPVISGLDTQRILGCGDYDFAGKEWLPVAISVQLTDYTSFEWTTDGDGYFDDPSALNVNYYPGFNDSWEGGANLCIDVFGNNSCQLTSSACMELVIPNQIVTISDAGWDGISSYLDMSTSSVPEVMAPVVNELIIMINKQGKYYWPEPNPPINQIGNWSATGYKARFDASACLPMYGDMLTSQSFLISGAFTYLPVLTNVPSLISDVLGENNLKVQMIYDWLTSEVWTNVAADFQYLQPGKAYLLVSKTASASYTVTFPDFDPEQPIVSTIGGPLSTLRNNSPWNNVTNTLQPHVIIFSQQATAELQPGDIIGAFDGMENCVGMAEFGNREHFFKVVAMGDDPTTDEVDGFQESEFMKFRLYRPTTGETFEVSFTWDQEYPVSDGNFAVNGVSMAKTMAMNITSVNPLETESNIRVLPNPATDVLHVVSDVEIKGITLVNNLGQDILSRTENSSRLQINVSNYPPGLYFLKIETKSGMIITKRVSIN